MQSEEDISRIAQRVYENTSFSGLWPDCYEISEDIIDALVVDGGIQTEYTDIIECYPTPGYRHYVVMIGKPVIGDSVIVDASFIQFACESDTPIDIAPRAELSPIITVSPKESYVFYPD